MRDISVNTDHRELRQMLDYLGVAAFLIDVVSADEFLLAAINSRHEQLTGMKLREVAGRDLDDLLAPEMAAKVKDKYRRCVEERAVIEYQETLDVPIGRTFWQTSLVPLVDEAGNVTRLLGTAHEVSSQVYLEREARYQSAVLGAYLDESPDGILVVDANNEIKTWNRRFLEIWDVPEDVMNARDGDAALQAVEEQLEDPDAFVQRVKELYTSLGEEEHGLRINMKDGRVLERHSRGLHGPEGEYWGRIWFYRDITLMQRMAEELERLSQTDPLTEVANRRAFMEALERECVRVRRHGSPLSLLLMDLDHFKQINDQYGHAAGDVVLKECARVVEPEIRASDYFARIGGEEFAIVLPESDLRSARQLAERVRRAIAAHAFDSPQGALTVTVSVGVATTVSDQDESPECLLIRADKWLYAAKSEGRNRVRSRDDGEGGDNPADH